VPTNRSRTRQDDGVIDLPDGTTAPPDALLRVQFKRPGEGGLSRKIGDVDTWKFYSGPLFVPEVDHGFDVRMFSRTHPWEFGEDDDVDAVFLSPAEARRYFVPGKRFTIWANGPIGFGEVLEAEWLWATQLASGSGVNQ
jgi:hypothetical protein